jgi:hypothetical protein
MKDHHHPAPSAPPGHEDTVLASLSWLDRLLPLWILLAMAAGLLLGRLVPGLQAVLGAVQVDHTSLPIAAGRIEVAWEPTAPEPAGPGAPAMASIGPLLQQSRFG